MRAGELSTLAPSCDCGLVPHTALCFFEAFSLSSRANNACRVIDFQSSSSSQDSRSSVPRLTAALSQMAMVQHKLGRHTEAVASVQRAIMVRGHEGLSW